MGSIIEEIIKENTILARLIAADQAAESGLYYLEAELRDAGENTAELPYGSGSGYGYGDGYGSGSGYGDGDGDGYGTGTGYGSGSGYGDGYGDGNGDIGSRQY